MTKADRDLLQRLGVTPGRPELLYELAMAVARRNEQLERRVEQLEGSSLKDRMFTGLSRAMGRA